MTSFRVAIFLGILLAGSIGAAGRSEAFRQTPLSPARATLAIAVERHFRAVKGPTGLVYYARGRSLPGPMLAALRAGERYRVVFVHRGRPLAGPDRVRFHLSIDGRRVRLAPASVRGDVPAFHATGLRVGRHRIRLTVAARGLRRQRLAYNGQILVTGGGPIYLFVSACGPRLDCRVELRQGGRLLYRRP